MLIWCVYRWVRSFMFQCVCLSRMECELNNYWRFQQSKGNSKKQYIGYIYNYLGLLSTISLDKYSKLVVNSSKYLCDQLFDYCIRYSILKSSHIHILLHNPHQITIQLQCLFLQYSLFSYILQHFIWAVYHFTHDWNLICELSITAMVIWILLCTFPWLLCRTVADQRFSSIGVMNWVWHCRYALLSHRH